MAYTPEDVIQTAYEDGTEVIGKHGFRVKWIIQRVDDSGRYHLYRVKPGMEAGLQRVNYDPTIEISPRSVNSNILQLAFSHGWLDLERRDKAAISLEKVSVCEDLRGERAALILGRMRWQPISPEVPILWMGILPTAPFGSQENQFASTLPSFVNQDGIWFNHPWRMVEVNYQPKKREIGVIAAATKDIDAFSYFAGRDKSWLLEEGGREVLRGVLDYSFRRLELYRDVRDLGSSKSIIAAS